jgi:squalene-hopene/tetraprenyl-beta-curcumene cyclase
MRLIEGAMAAVVLGLSATGAPAIDEEHAKKADAMIARTISYLRTQQQADGSWSVNPEGPQMPAVTGLVINGMLLDASIDGTDEDVAAGLANLISLQKEDGGIYDLILPSYNTSIAVSALSKADTKEAAEAVTKAVAYLRGLQWWEGAPADGAGDDAAQRVDRSSPFYGGVGYGHHSRPDMSNLGFFVQAMHDAGVEGDDPAFQRALVFLSRTQMHEAVNDMAYADGSSQGGFIYATGPEGDRAGEGESKAGVIEETLDDGTNVSRLRAYGSMTYAGFKSYLYAQLDRDDPRVRYAREWISRNYTLEENPGVGQQGLYYYFVTFARALDAWGEETIEVVGANGEMETRDWANDLIDRLDELQKEDGSFENVHDRWMEGDPVLVTAYALIALEEARN